MADSKTIGIALLGAGIFAKTGTFQPSLSFPSISLPTPPSLLLHPLTPLTTTAHLPALKAQPQSPTPTVLRAIYSRSQKSSSELASHASEELGYAVEFYAEDANAEGGGKKGLESLLARDDISVVIVALPITVQPQVVLQALAAGELGLFDDMCACNATVNVSDLTVYCWIGKHVLCEKPIGPFVKAAQELIADYKQMYEPKGL